MKYTAAYVEHTGHVLAAFSTTDNPSGGTNPNEKTGLLASGVRVRQLPAPPSRIPFLIAVAGHTFRLDYPVQNFLIALGENLAYTATATPSLPAWLKIDALPRFSGDVPVDTPEQTFDITIKAQPSGVGTPLSENFKIKVVTRASASDAAFIVPADQLNLFSDEATVSVVRTPRAYQVQEGALTLIPQPNDRSKLSFVLDPNQLLVSLQSGEPSPSKDIPIWALLRRSDGVEQIGTGVIAKNTTSGSIAFTLNASTSYELLLLVSGYDPLVAAMRVGDAVEWPAKI